LAAELGFCDQSHFTRIFRRMTGFTPREYARRHDLEEQLR
jgi:AraC-like DNA-binding protein